MGRGGGGEETKAERKNLKKNKNLVVAKTVASEADDPRVHPGKRNFEVQERQTVQWFTGNLFHKSAARGGSTTTGHRGIAIPRELVVVRYFLSHFDNPFRENAHDIHSVHGHRFRIGIRLQKIEKIHANARRYINQSIQSINSSINQSINQSISRSINQSINQFVNQSIGHWINQSIKHSMKMKQTHHARVVDESRVVSCTSGVNNHDAVQAEKVIFGEASLAIVHFPAGRLRCGERARRRTRWWVLLRRSILRQKSRNCQWTKRREWFSFPITAKKRPVEWWETA